MKDTTTPRHPKRKRQPTAECMREQLRLAADEIIELKTKLDWFDRHMVAGSWMLRYPMELADKKPWWRRLLPRGLA